MTKHSNSCSGFHEMKISRRDAMRRDAMRIGFCTALGLSLPDLLRHEAKAAAQPGFFKEGKAKSIIHLHLPGGMAQQESWDPKPEAPSEYRGAFGVAKTNTGEIFSENFARLAKIADKITVVRSVMGKFPITAKRRIIFLRATHRPPSLIIRKWAPSFRIFWASATACRAGDAAGELHFWPEQ